MEPAAPGRPKRNVSEEVEVEREAGVRTTDDDGEHSKAFVFTHKHVEDHPRRAANHHRTK